MRPGIALFTILFIITALPCAAETLTYVDLVNRLTDLEALAVLPAQGETCAQWSSYDRASKYDEQTGKYLGWDANWDGMGIIRKEGDTLVFAEMEGPGCIWRIWSAMAKQGHVKIYLDGATEPVVDLPFDGYFNLQNPPFDYPGLVHTTAQGRNCYVPIPYQKSCKIVGEKDWGAYFEFNYTTFPKGTIVPTFKRDLSQQEADALKKASVFLTKKLGTDPADRSKKTVIAPVIDAAPGQTITVARIKGPNAITSLHAMINSKKHSEAQLRSVILKIYWDGEKQPSVWSPIGDFFGTAPGLSEYKSLTMGVTPNSAYSYWYMPFDKEAVVEIKNEGRERFTSQMVITYSTLSKPLDQLGRFHAKWHRDAFLPKEEERWIDWTVLKTQGRGRFCGMALEVWNPKGGWWGEGDEKWFVDGEKFPSTFGTGSEDYFGYAWCDPSLFQNAYHNQTRNDNDNNSDHVSVNRWQITENIPFQKSFDGYIEKYFLNDRPTLYASTVYWYLSPGGVDPYGPVPLKDRLNWYVRPVVKKKPGIEEGEAMKVLSKTGGTAEIQRLGERFSEEAHLWWIGAKPGDTLTLALPIPKKGKYTIALGMTKARDYGIVQWSIDGKKIGEPIDLYNDGVIPFGPVELGVVELTKGEHQLTATIVGANESAIKSYMVGLDYVSYKVTK
ncbi:MAG: glycoside hydrolase family 172 protein [Armatimonadota bacterium]